MGCCSSKTSKYTDADLPEHDGFTFHVLRSQDEAEAVELATRSFLGSDGGAAEPMVSWVLGSDSKLPAAADREAFARAMQRWCFVQAQHFGGVVIGARKAGKLAGTIVVYPPGTWVEGGDQLCMLLNMTMCRGMSLPPMDAKKYGPFVSKRMNKVEVALASKEINAIRPPKLQFWKVEVLAVDPAFQGQGVSRALMSALFRLADKVGSAPCCVECGTEKLAPLYKKLGFTDGESSKKLVVNGDAGPGFEISALLRKSGTPAQARAAKASQVAPQS